MNKISHNSSSENGLEQGVRTHVNNQYPAWQAPPMLTFHTHSESSCGFKEDRMQSPHKGSTKFT